MKKIKTEEQSEHENGFYLSQKSDQDKKRDVPLQEDGEGDMLSFSDNEEVQGEIVEAQA